MHLVFDDGTGNDDQEVGEEGTREKRNMPYVRIYSSSYSDCFFSLSLTGMHFQFLIYNF